MRLSELLNPKSIDRMWLFLLGTAFTFCTLWLLFLVLNGSGTFPLTNFKDRAIGITVLLGIDPSVRTSLYIGLTMLSLPLFIGYTALITFVYNSFIRLHASSIRFGVATWHLLLLLGLLGASSAFFSLSAQAKSDIFIWLEHFADGIAGSAGVIIILFFGLLALAYLIYKNRMWFSRETVDKSLLMYLAIASVATLVLMLVSNLSVYVSSLRFLAMGTFMVAVLHAAKLLSVKYRFSGLEELLKDPAMNIFNLLLPAVLLIAVAALSRPDLSYDSTIFILYPALSLLCFSAYYAVCRMADRAGISRSDLNAALIMSGIVLFLIPVSIPLVDELQFSLNQVVYLPVHILIAIVCGSLVLIALALFFHSLRKPVRQMDRMTIIGRYYFPALISAFILFRYRYPILLSETYDMFHKGENLITAQQYFSFGSIPYVDIFPTHGFSALVCQILYGLINGYSAIEPSLWAWIPCVIGGVLLFFLLKQLTDAVFSFIVIVFLPMAGLFGAGNASLDLYYYSFCLIPVFTIVWALRDMTIRRQIVHWLAIIFLLIWRIDFGLPAIAATLFIFFVYYLQRYMIEKRVHVREIVSSTAIGFAMFIMLGVMYLVVIVLAHGSISDILVQDLEFLRFQDATMSYAGLLPDSSGLTSAMAAVEYFILPGVGILYVLGIIYLILFEKTRPSDTQIILGFIALLTLIMALRSLQRHSLMESLNFYLYVLLILALPIFFCIGKKYASAVFFMGGIVAFVVTLILIVPSMGTQISTYSVLPQEDTSFFQVVDWTQHDRRVVDNRAQYGNLVDYVNASLNEDQTFYDFTNSPLLYVMADRKDLSYLIPNLYQTSEPVQKSVVNTLQASYDRDELPLVVFKQGSHWDNVDGVPNEIRSYRIAEFIYQHYQPAGYAGMYQVWVSQNGNLSQNNISQDASLTCPLKTNSEEIRTNDAQLSVDSGIKVVCGHNDPQLDDFSEVGSLRYVANTSSAYLKLRYRSTAPGHLQVFYGFADDPYSEAMSATMAAEISGAAYNEAYLPIPATGKNLTRLRIDPADNSTFELLNVDIVTCKTGLIPTGKVEQNFDLQKLPYMWGTYDPYQAATHTTVQETLCISESVISPDGLTLPINPALNRSAGNYVHMRIKSSDHARVKIAYGNSTRSTISFDVIPSDTYEDYLVRISSQWAWYSQPVDYLTITADKPVTVDKIVIRQGD